MGAFKVLALQLAVLTATVAGSAPAGGQCRLCEKPTTALTTGPDTEAIALEIESSLNFDRLVLLTAGTGAAVVRPDGSNSAEGALAQVSARAMVGSAVVRGAPGRAVRIELPRRIDLYSVHGGRLSVDSVTSDLPSLPRLDSAGTLTFHFGGRVSVTGESEGDYRGEMPITVEYQ